MDIFKRIKEAFSDKGEEKAPIEMGNVSIFSVRDTFSDCYDLVERGLYPGGGERIKATLFFIDGLVSGQSIAEEVIKPITEDRRFLLMSSDNEMQNMMLGGLVYAATAKKRTEMKDVISDLLNGFCAVIFPDTGVAITFEVKDKDKRSIDQPKEEKVVKGSKDAFIEVLKTNSTLVRKKLRDPNLKIKSTVIGSESATMAAIVYIKGFTNPEIVNEAERRLSSIKTDGVLTAASIEEAVVDNPKTPFPQLISTERPDKFCLNILEGRVGILVDGLPMGYLAPGTFSQYFKVPEDSANHFIVSSALTMLRYVSLFLTLFVPAFYTAVALFHHEMIPTKLMQSMIDAKASVPFPTAFEVLAMLISFELLQEAGLRLPNPVGETVSIIGALIVGQSAVEAKVVSPVVVVVIALAGIAGYTMPNQDMGSALRLCRFLLTVMAVLFGIFGLAVGAGLILYHLCTLESFNVPYITPFGEGSFKYMTRAVLRSPMKIKRKAEPALHPENIKEREN